MPMLTETTTPTAVWEKLADWIVSRRVRITTVVFLLLIAEDILNGIKPHNPANVEDVTSLVGVTFIAVGLWARSWAAGTLHKLTHLTTHGPYSMVRNPLYLGSFLMMIGFCTLIDDPENIWIVLGPFLALFALKVRDEERKLTDRFGAEWNEYGSVDRKAIAVGRSDASQLLARRLGMAGRPPTRQRVANDVCRPW